MTLRDFHVPENMVANLLFTHNHWRKSTKATLLICLKYHCLTMEKRHGFYFPVILGKDVKHKERIV